MKNHASKIILMSLFIVFTSYSLVGQQEANRDSERTINVDTTLVNVQLVISDKSGRRISGIRKDDISVFVDGHKMEVDFFADSDELLRYAIVVDSSGSARPVIGRIKKASRKFVTFMGPEGEGLILSFDKSVNKTMKGFSSDSKKLKDAIDFISVSENPGSVMNDAFEQLISNNFVDIKGRKAIIVLTDGDVDGKKSHSSIIEQYGRSDIAVYPIFYQTRPLFPSRVKSVSFEELTKVEPVKYLHSLAAATGGRLLVAEADDFELAFQQIADELRKQYVIGFYLDAAGNSKSREITIKVNHPDVFVRTKQSIKIVSH